jgi:hypothetical protein
VTPAFKTILDLVFFAHDKHDMRVAAMKNLFLAVDIQIFW